MQQISLIELLAFGIESFSIQHVTENIIFLTGRMQVDNVEKIFEIYLTSPWQIFLDDVLQIDGRQLAGEDRKKFFNRVDKAENINFSYISDVFVNNCKLILKFANNYQFHVILSELNDDFSVCAKILCLPSGNIKKSITFYKDDFQFM